MTSAVEHPIWIQARKPICDVPWLGTSVILSDGSVNFCCFSPAVVGNVNQQTFEEIWNGPAMQKIRSALSKNVLPPECRTSSCPIYRGDDRSYLVLRMEGRHSFAISGNHDPHQEIREKLQTSSLRINGEDNPEISLEFQYHGEPIFADLFAAIRYPDGSFRFLPDFEDCAVPFQTYLELNESFNPLRIQLLEKGAPVRQTGEHQICAALFVVNSNPNIASNCYWASTKAITL